jgi:outer membrane protein
MKRFLVFSLVALALGAGAAHAQEIKIAVFDAQRISEETAEGRRIQAELTAFRDRKQAEINSKIKEAQDLENQLTAQALSLSPDKRAQMEKDIQRRRLELEQMQQTAQREFQMELADAQGRFQQQLWGVIQQFAREEGITALFEADQVVYHAESIDVTSALVDRFNQAVQPPAARPAGGR